MPSLGVVPAATAESSRVSGDCENASYSHKKGRLYCRVFNHQEARDLRAQGWAYNRIAEKLGVNVNSVIRACDPVRRKIIDAKTAAYTREHYRAPCKGGCGTMIWTNVQRRTGYCRTCTGKLRATTVRDDALLCSRCGVWQPDEAFPRRADAKSRRQRAGLCRPCQTADRQERRERNRVPCTRCGTLVLAENEKTAGHRHSTGLCLPCWHAERSAA